jgi:hypothetical protein
MNIIQSTRNPSGAYPPVQNWSGDTPPEGYMEITCDTAEFYNGFIVPTIEGGKVTAIAEATEAHKAWLDAEAAKPKPEATPTAEDTALDLLADHEYRICMMELNGSAQ